MKRYLVLVIILLDSTAWAVDLTVSAAISLTQAFQEVGTQFEIQNPGSKIKFNFASSGMLLQQILNGAPVDVFASADSDTMDKAIAKNAVSTSDSKVFTFNKLVVVTTTQSNLVLKQLADLKKPEIKRIAMGLPASVPAGHYAQAALDKAGLSNELKDKIIGTQNVRQSLDYVAREEVDAGSVYISDALLMPDKVKVAFIVPTVSAIQYPIAKVSTTTQPELANKFISFVLSANGQAILKKFGFGN